MTTLFSCSVPIRNWKEQSCHEFGDRTTLPVFVVIVWVLVRIAYLRKRHFLDYLRRRLPKRRRNNFGTSQPLRFLTNILLQLSVEDGGRTDTTSEVPKLCGESSALYQSCHNLFGDFCRIFNRKSVNATSYFLKRWDFRKCIKLTLLISFSQSK